MSERTTTARHLGIALALFALATAQSAAQRVEALPDDLEEIGVDQNLDAQLPLDLRFVDETGQAVLLGDYFRQDKPVLLVLAYYECPMLCSLVLGGLVDALRELDWTPGEEFEIVTATIDPGETHQLAKLKKASYLESYGRLQAAGGWHFLTGEQGAIDALAGAVGFRYHYLEDDDEYAHPAALVLLTPDGRISRYFFGVRHDPKTLRLSLAEASEGKVGSVVDRFLLYCYRYDAEEGRYAPVAMRIMQIGAMLTAMFLGAMLLAFWLRESRQKRLA